MAKATKTVDLVASTQKVVVLEHPPDRTKIFETPDGPVEKLVPVRFEKADLFIVDNAAVVYFRSIAGNDPSATLAASVTNIAGADEDDVSVLANGIGPLVNVGTGPMFPRQAERIVLKLWSTGTPKVHIEGD